MNVLVTLTAFNEAQNIGEIIRQINQQKYGCLVVDDGSLDATADIAESLGATVIKHCMNLGQGYAVLTSFKAAIRENCDIIIEMDADGQHDPKEIKSFIEKLENTNVDIVVGSRIKGSNYQGAPTFRKAFLPHFTRLINRVTGYEMTDAMCGFRAFRKRSLATVEPILNDMLEPQYIAAEMFIRFAKAGLRIAEIPIHLKDRSSGASYKGFIRYGFGVLKAIARTLTDKSYHIQRQL